MTSRATGVTRALRLPAYGQCIVDVLPSVLGALGVPDEHDVLGLPPARRYVVLLVDGLGWHLLRGAPTHSATWLRRSRVKAARPTPSPWT